MQLRKIFVLLFVINATQPVFAEENKFEKSIQKFEAQDKENMPKAGGILFLGSSSIRLWKLEKWFNCPEHTLINRGFGGSQTSDVLHFFDRIVSKYKPKTIVFYCGDNDIAAKKSPEQVLKDFDTFMSRLKEILPETELIYLPVKQSFSRAKMWEQMKQVNEGIIQRAARNTRLHYCDTIPLLRDEKGELDQQYFAKDGLHLSEAGYEKWTKLVKSYLIELE